MPGGTGTAHFRVHASAFAKASRSGYNGAASRPRSRPARAEPGTSMVARLFAPQFVHPLSVRGVRRPMCISAGKMKLRLGRQLADHSTWLAPYNVLMYMFQAVPNKPVLAVEQFSRARAAARQLADDPRRGAEPVRRGAHQGGRQQQRLGLLFVLQERLEALLSQVVRRRAPVGRHALPEDRRAGERDPERARRDVRDAAAGREARRAPRSVRRIAALSPRAGHAEFRRLLHRRRRREVRLARRRSHHVRRDLHPHRRESHRRQPHHPVLRRRAADEVRLHDARSIAGSASISSRPRRRRTRKARRSASSTAPSATSIRRMRPASA